MKSFFIRIRDLSKTRIDVTARSPQISLFHLICFLLLSCSFELQATAQVPADQTADRAAIVRPCPALPEDSKSARKDKTKRKGVTSDQEEVPPACLEVKLTGIEVQEFLQNFVREQAWAMGQQHAGEDLWTFVRLLDGVELARVAKTEAASTRVAWTEGKGFVAVRTTEAKEGFTRVQVSARFQGRGETKDTFAPPSTLWPLLSNGTLEGGMIAALESHIITKH